MKNITNRIGILSENLINYQISVFHWLFSKKFSLISDFDCLHELPRVKSDAKYWKNIFFSNS